MIGDKILRIGSKTRQTCTPTNSKAWSNSGPLDNWRGVHLWQGLSKPRRPLLHPALAKRVQGPGIKQGEATQASNAAGWWCGGGDKGEMKSGEERRRGHDNSKREKINKQNIPLETVVEEKETASRFPTLGLLTRGCSPVRLEYRRRHCDFEEGGINGRNIGKTKEESSVTKRKS
ncbi:hypothetical protein LZ30DRAFT_373075 [Colletotrichum cereale]|nr:hypothetical protein LZ30DRAFT_373075 [Colletotrichum cereale]